MIQDASDLYKWAKDTEETRTIKFMFLLTDDYERSSSFLSKVCYANRHIDGTIQLHAVFSSAPDDLRQEGNKKLKFIFM